MFNKLKNLMRKRMNKLNNTVVITDELDKDIKLDDTNVVITGDAWEKLLNTKKNIQIGNNIKIDENGICIGKNATIHNRSKK